LDFCVEEGRFALLITREAIRNVYEKNTKLPDGGRRKMSLAEALGGMLRA
jgi:hypothetical protein